MRRKCLFSLFCWCVWLSGAGIQLSAQNGPYSFIHYGTEQGLSNDHISYVVRDRPGFVWVGTISGLNRFDGRRFRVFKHDPQASNSLPGDYISGLKAGPDGWLWVSTNQGLCRLDPERLHFEPVLLPGDRDSAANDHLVGPVGFDSRGRAWVNGKKALYCIDLKAGKTLKYQPAIGNYGPFPVLIDHYDKIWITANTRLYRFDPDARRTYAYPDSVSSLTAMQVVEDHRHDIWLTTWDKGMYRYNRTADSLEQHVSGPALGLNRQILPDLTPAGRPFFWVGGGLSGLFLYFPDNHLRQDMPYDYRDPFSHNGFYTTCFFKDERTGDVWIGTEIGLEHYSPTAIRFGRAIIPVEPDFGPFNLVSGAVQDNTDPGGRRYFIGVWANNFFAWDRHTNRFKRYRTGHELPVMSQEVFSIIQDREGYLWLTLTGAIARYDPRNGKTMHQKPRFRKPERANKILAAVQDRNGGIWFGANVDGLFRLNPRTQQAERVPLPDEVTFQPTGDLFVHTLAADSSGRIWMGTNKGLTRYDPLGKTARRFLIPGKPDPYDCIGVTISRNGHIWCTVSNWLIELDTAGKVLQTFRPEQGIRCTRGVFIVEDHSGNIWFNSDYLLHCLDIRSKTFSHYGLADGLFSNAPTDGLSILPNGEIIVGFQNAFNYFNPASLRRNATPPPVVITSVKILDREHPPGEPLVLRPGETMLTVEFAALNFSQPERNRYAYKLEGFDPDWNYTDRPVAIYTNLDGGEYILHLKACNNDGVWNETGTTLEFRVIPPIYERWYFYLALILLGAGITYAIARYRYLQRRRLDVFRQRLARDLHDEMGSTLSSIRFFSDFAQTQVAGAKPEALPVLQRISQSATALSESMQDIIWAMKNRQDHLEDIASRMTEFGLRLLEARGIRFKTRIDERFPVKRLAPEQRRNLYLIFKEAVNNAAKYAGCSEVELVFHTANGILTLEINDNGQGFDPDSKEAGNGLYNMRQRAAEIGGRLEIISAPGKGTRVVLRVKLI
ncbi:MAG: ATP-binding protein [Thermoanaerobaculia bacterium]|nr:ATP-binding protein [Thermoanaerobaculia bacterium]